MALEAEDVGLNVSEHGSPNELHELLDTMKKQGETGNLTDRAAVQPFTEVGLIAQRYNTVIGALETSKADIDDLRETEQQLREAKTVAEDASRAKSEFLANMSHEIRTPLHGILSFAGFGIRRANDNKPEKIEDYFRKIDISGRRLLELVNNLLDLSKLEAGRMEFDFERQDVSMVITGVVDEFHSLLSASCIKIDFVHSEQSVEADVDAPKLMQVIRNLMSNAVKFSPSGSTIEIKLQHDAETICLGVSDQGVGIPEDELESVFEKFYQSTQTKSGAGGTGLGLPICRQIIEAHGGRIWAERASNQGTIFRVEMPRFHTDAPIISEPTNKPAKRSGWKSGSRETVTETDS